MVQRLTVSTDSCDFDSHSVEFIILVSSLEHNIRFRQPTTNVVVRKMSEMECTEFLNIQSLCLLYYIQNTK